MLAQLTMTQHQFAILLISLLSCEAFTVPRQTSQRSGYTQLTSAQVWSPPIEEDTFLRLPSKNSRNQGLLDSFASSVASWVLESISSQSTTSSEKLFHLSKEGLVDIVLEDVKERNSLVTADFTTAIYEDSCRFKDGSGLDGAYPMKPWMLGCKILFKGDKSSTTILDNTLVATSELISFRFESDLEFRGPFCPRVFLTGRIVMKRNPQTGLISSYREIWDEDVWDVVKNARLQI
jgi:hypothetical protein